MAMCDGAKGSIRKGASSCRRVLGISYGNSGTAGMLKPGERLRSACARISMGMLVRANSWRTGVVRIRSWWCGPGNGAPPLAAAPGDGPPLAAA